MFPVFMQLEVIAPDDTPTIPPTPQRAETSPLLIQLSINTIPPEPAVIPPTY